MTLIQLEYIIALDDYCHFALAAKNCFVTQPTLSMQIQKLENTIGVLIFDRSKHPVEPTQIGKKIIAQARVIKAESIKIANIIAEEKMEIKGKVKIGIIPTIAPYLIPYFISNFVKKYPDINLEINEYMTDDLLRALRKDQIDIGLLATPLKEEDMKEYPLFDEQFFIYTSFRHPLYQNDLIAANSLKNEDLWILNEGHCFRTQTLAVCNVKKSEKFNNRILYESGSLETLKKMVDNSGGYTLLPELFTLDMHKEDKGKLRAFVAPVPTREVSLIVKKSFAKTRLLEALHKEILINLPPTLVSKKTQQKIKF